MQQMKELGRVVQGTMLHHVTELLYHCVSEP